MAWAEILQIFSEIFSMILRTLATKGKRMSRHDRVTIR